MTGEALQSHWYVIHTKAKQEERAESNLRAWQIETLTPRLREPRPLRSESDSPYRITPLFPGYLFARFNARELLAKVRLTRGVHSVVGFGECATAIDESVIDLVRSRIQEDGLVHVAEAVPGDNVEILAGPLRSLSGLFERTCTARDRVMILLATVGSGMRVQVPRAFIRRVPTSVVA